MKGEGEEGCQGLDRRWNEDEVEEKGCGRLRESDMATGFVQKRNGELVTVLVLCPGMVCVGESQH